MIAYCSICSTWYMDTTPTTLLRCVTCHAELSWREDAEKARVTRRPA